MIFRVKKVYVTVSPLFFVVMIWVFFTNKMMMFLSCFFSLCLHEIGHIAMIFSLKEKIAILRIVPIGFSCRLKNQSKVSGKNMMKILIAGPAVNFLMAGLFFLWTKEFAMMNFLLGVFNLLPVGELDGGRIFDNISSQLKNNMVK